jgi:hypothetical protein
LNYRFATVFAFQLVDADRQHLMRERRQLGDGGGKRASIASEKRKLRLCIVWSDAMIEKQLIVVGVKRALFEAIFSGF